MNRWRLVSMVVLFGVVVCATAASFWISGWMEKRPLPPSGGLFIPGAIVLPGPHFLQFDPKWGGDTLGQTKDSLASAGCAVTSAAMILAGYGIETDPGRLNRFLSLTPGGYTPEGWIYWEKAAEAAPDFLPKLLPHYEDKPSFFLIDWNLLRGNPVIVRLRYPNGITHFLVICGKRGEDYLVRDPGKGGARGVYPLKDFGGPIEALRFYRKP
ncbi:MAG: C39 family peptidase [Chthoniobacterales bacterium]|nr:C39 family peptidase [Chthoniobacterales bacterium]